MRKALKWLGIGLVGLVVLAVVTLVIVGESRLNKTYDIRPEAIPIPTDEAAIARGAYIFAASRAGCHGENLAGGVVLDDPGIGYIPAPNLTVGKGGIGSAYSNADFVRAIRHGIRPDGTPLAIMPAQAYWYFSDEDLGAVIAFVKSAPPVDNDPGMYTAVGYGLLGIWLFACLQLIGPQPFLTAGLARLGSVAAVAMLFGLLAGPQLASGVDFNQSLLT